MEAIAKPIRRTKNALLCGAAIGIKKTVNLGSQEKITCVGCLAILARGKRTKITPKGDKIMCDTKLPASLRSGPNQ